MAFNISLLAAEVKKSKYSLIPSLSENDVLTVWDNVSEFIERVMLQQKGVCIHQFGTFTFSRRKLELGGSKVVMIQRPVFVLSEKMAQTHALNYQKQHVTSSVPVIPLNYTAVSNNTQWERGTVEMCVREILQCLSHLLATGKTVELDFTGVGRLLMREKKIKMKFFKEFIRSLDTSGSTERAFEMLSTRCGTSESSIMSAPKRSATATSLVLPKIVEASPEDEDGVGGLNLTASPSSLPHSAPSGEDKLHKKCDKATLTSAKPDNVEPHKRPPTPYNAPRNCSSSSTKSTSLTYSSTSSSSSSSSSSSHTSSRPHTSCSHSIHSGLELCYLCHQRNKYNIPVLVAEEKRHKEKMEDQMLYEYRCLKDKQDIDRQKVRMASDRQVKEETAHFNLQAGEKKKEQDKYAGLHYSKYHPSYVFQQRPLTPPPVVKQEEYRQQLENQIDHKHTRMRRMEEKEKEAEKNEHAQLMKELAQMDEVFCKTKAARKLEYQLALDDQLKSKKKLAKELAFEAQPVFAVQDANANQLKERKERARDLCQDHLLAMERKQELKKEREMRMKQHDAELLLKNREELLRDIHTSRREKWEARCNLEKEWQETMREKKLSLLREEKHANTPSILLQDQCKRYLRCRQCQRRRNNYGQSNILRESRYTAGSKLMV